jgi:hypothetical protein
MLTLEEELAKAGLQIHHQHQARRSNLTPSQKLYLGWKGQLCDLFLRIPK